MIHALRLFMGFLAVVMPLAFMWSLAYLLAVDAAVVVGITLAAALCYCAGGLILSWYDL